MIFRALQEAFNEIRQDRLVMVAASVGFYVLLSLVPAISTTLTVYRSLYDPQTILSQLGNHDSWPAPFPLFEIISLLTDVFDFLLFTIFSTVHTSY